MVAGGVERPACPGTFTITREAETEGTRSHSTLHADLQEAEQGTERPGVEEGGESGQARDGRWAVGESGEQGGGVGGESGRVK